ncbi:MULTISPECIES: asparagine synthase (glutamine-hydrolyzing) [unclassified Sphingomonas]|uniref:asparagine synthase (glutamine-hydrolyzing) n=1 Tax=unclassified Sphingomonas TaxID=196159 RepID=UPI00226B002E|nr:MULTISPECIES: asparagine synthase (glutamine-hydrolyzing) [unclassified Sphingomonas]
MCGIAGIIAAGPVEPRLVNAMTDRIAHRGPDDHGFWRSAPGDVVLGQRRLAIIDLSPAGHQPMPSADDRIVLVLNGEIYNHLDIRAELEGAGLAPAWRGTSDTETLVEAIAAWGIDRAVERCVGMFALASWDQRSRTLTLARDRMGEKPLYYGRLGDKFVFASELKAIETLPGFDAPIDRVALADMLSRGYVPAPRSIYRGVFKLPPAHMLTIRPDAGADLPAPVPYWSYRQVIAAGLADPVRDAGDARAGLRAALERAVAEQAIADVPIGAFLSGGIDSSTVVALLQKVTSHPVETFSIGFAEAGFDEAGYARAVAAHLGTNHHEHYVGVDDTIAVIPKLPAMYDEPFADSSQIPTYLVSHFAKQHVTVALTGDGGDELFGGYNRYVQLARAWAAMQRLPKPLRVAAGTVLSGVSPAVWNRFARLVGGHDRPDTFGSKVKRSLQRMRMATDMPSLTRTFLDEWALIGTPVLGVDAGDLAREFAVDVDSAWPNTIGLMAGDVQNYLPDDILCKVDRATMAVSLEGRAPFLDHRVVEFAARIPLDLKIRGGTGKSILRDILFEEAPRALFERPKAGFGIPVGQWMRGPLRDWAEALLDPAALARDGLLDPAPIRARWQRHLNGTDDASQSLWSVLMFQAWRAAR